MIDNPEYKYDDNMYKVCKDGCTHVGFELWQVTTGTLFDDILVTDSLEEAQKFAEETFFKKKDGEKEMYDKIQAEKRASEEAEMDEMGGMDEMDMDEMMMGDEF
uniref:Calreticulin n=2 Tax=Grammatophora oceanica TaxID=210454 RepID=A0A7S1UMH0_9STRA|mmetsp:Transcript_12698/g.18706  ORF Transcript_12698/g.18706 Transcript_12698/m.18706 type:complete len:104 (+) Transcript_12698:53-364(+)